MARAPIQVIIFPFMKVVASEVLYAVFKRRRREVWQAISGGAEDSETPLEAAVRETREEAGIVTARGFVALDSQASIPADIFSGTDHWPFDVLVVPQYAFGVQVADDTITLSAEHCEHAWLPFPEAHERLTWDSNRVALWELDQRLRRGMLPSSSMAPDPVSGSRR